jgi:hypothetical protein
MESETIGCNRTQDLYKIVDPNSPNAMASGSAAQEQAADATRNGVSGSDQG